MSTLTNIAAHQNRVGAWVRSRFGDSNMKPIERAARLLEEAIELAQAEGMSATDAHRLTDFVYDKPAGEPKQEIGGIGVCLLAWGAATGENIWTLTRNELARIEAKSAEHFHERHKIKSDAGVAMKATGGKP